MKSVCTLSMLGSKRTGPIQSTMSFEHICTSQQGRFCSQSAFEVKLGPKKRSRVDTTWERSIPKASIWMASHNRFLECPSWMSLGSTKYPRKIRVHQLDWSGWLGTITKLDWFTTACCLQGFSKSHSWIQQTVASSRSCNLCSILREQMGRC
jgi:hypothetical protein